MNSTWCCIAVTCTSYFCFSDFAIAECWCRHDQVVMCVIAWGRLACTGKLPPSRHRGARTTDSYLCVCGHISRCQALPVIEHIRLLGEALLSHVPVGAKLCSLPHAVILVLIRLKWSKSPHKSIARTRRCNLTLVSAEFVVAVRQIFIVCTGCITLTTDWFCCTSASDGQTLHRTHTKDY